MLIRLFRIPPPVVVYYSFFHRCKYKILFELSYVLEMLKVTRLFFSNYDKYLRRLGFPLTKSLKYRDVDD